jgi:glycosyltransferase involved in cell wall biosynthesis
VTPNQSMSGLFRGHPVRPVDPQDPLARLHELRSAGGWKPGMTGASARPHIGFICQWENPPERTGSYTPWNLRGALRLEADTVDLGVQFPRLPWMALKAIHARYRGGKLTTTWSSSRLTDAYMAHSLRREFSRNPAAGSCSAALMVQIVPAALGLPVPLFVYNDIGHDAFISGAGGLDAYAARKSVRPSTVARLREQELAVYERATGVIAMSQWYARALIQQAGVSPEKVHVVHPGASAGRALRYDDVAADPVSDQGYNKQFRPLCERAAPRRRLLYVGRQHTTFDFYAKGADLAIAALARLRRDYDPQITLTFVGPDTWLGPGSPPDGVRFLGNLPSASDVSALYDSHDLLVMPSRLEGFGIVFVEALARGLPCIGRDAYAMPEIITPGVSGALVTNDDEGELAATIAAVLADDALYEACHKRAPEIAEYFSWERAAWEIAQLIAKLGSTS